MASPIAVFSNLWGGTAAVANPSASEKLGFQYQVAWQWAFSAFGDAQPTTEAKRYADCNEHAEHTHLRRRKLGRAQDRIENGGPHWQAVGMVDGHLVKVSYVDCAGGNVATRPTRVRPIRDTQEWPQHGKKRIFATLSDKKINLNCTDQPA